MIMPFEGTHESTVEDALEVTADDLHFYITEVMPEVHESDAHGVRSLPEPGDEIIFPAFDLLGEPFTGHAA